MALDLINDIGPGGEYMTSMHTAKLCRTETWNPEIGVRGTRGKKDVHESVLKNIDQKKDEMLAAYTQPELSKEIKSSLIKYLVSRGIEKNFL